MDIQITSQEIQPTIYIRERVSLESMTEAFDRNYGKLVAYLTENGSMLAGPPYAAYMNSDINDMDTEFGFPVATAIKGEGEIKAGNILPFETALTATHKGSYETLNMTYEALYKHLADKNFTLIGPHYDFYINDPCDTPEEELLTKVVLPISTVPMVFCQSCGMPLPGDETKGSEADGSKSEDYCIHCYKDGAFTQDISMDEMIEVNIKYLDSWNPGMEAEEARSQLKTFMPSLKRWSK